MEGRDPEINYKLGSRRQHVLRGDTSGLRKELTVSSDQNSPGILVVQARYTNTGSSPVKVTGWTNHRYSIPFNGPSNDGKPAFWSFQSGSYSKRPSRVLPLTNSFRQENFQGLNSIDSGGGTPVVGVWRRDAGIAVGHLELSPKLVSLPVAMQAATQAEIRIDYKADRTLARRRLEVSFLKHLLLEATPE